MIMLENADLNIWNEPLSSATLVLQDSPTQGPTSRLVGTFSVKAATLNKLVERLAMAMVKDVDARMCDMCFVMIGLP